MRDKAAPSPKAYLDPPVPSKEQLCNSHLFWYCPRNVHSKKAPPKRQLNRVTVFRFRGLCSLLEGFGRVYLLSCCSAEGHALCTDVLFLALLVYRLCTLDCSTQTTAMPLQLFGPCSCRQVKGPLFWL